MVCKVQRYGWFCFLLVFVLKYVFLRPYGEYESSSTTSDDEYEDGHGYASEPTVGIMDEVVINSCL